MKKFILILLILMIFFLPIVSAQMCEVAQVRNNLKKALYEYFNSPATAQLELGKIKDLLDFYLDIQPGQTQADCSGTGQNSGVSYEIIVQEADGITTIIPKCSDGTTFGECSISKPKYCYNGNVVNKCSVCGCASGSCSSDESCGIATNTTPTAFCGDGSCNNAETCSTCAADCGSCPVQNTTPFCGDGSCNNAETCSTCAQDCGSCPIQNQTPVCGDNLCNGAETCSLCTADCGSCPLPDSCSDSDGGQSSLTQGMITGTSNGNGYSYSDLCQNSNTLLEYYCSGNVNASLVVGCTNGCFN